MTDDPLRILYDRRRWIESQIQQQTEGLRRDLAQVKAQIVELTLERATAAYGEPRIQPGDALCFTDEFCRWWRSKYPLSGHLDCEAGALTEAISVSAQEGRDGEPTLLVGIRLMHHTRYRDTDSPPLRYDTGIDYAQAQAMRRAYLESAGHDD